MGVEPDDNGIGLESRKELLGIARESMIYFLKHRKHLPYDSKKPELLSHSGAFVTLKKDGQLRGCIGYITSEKPLYLTVIEAAVSAAFNDPRFPPVRDVELDSIEIEISVLTPPKRVDDVAEIVPGRDGLIISDSFHRGLLLPQVATEYDWDRETFLSHTCLKAGLPEDAWKSGVSIERFEALVFNEADLK
ncbi:MAG TPA: AmmeMemoRadiSam system protein A [Acidobacteriota bacterium]|nr:AmmeMemoRadiSam system protein A [Acidobacteriota bacterium]